MATIYSPNIVTNELMLMLDAGNVRSNPGSGTSWFDLSGNGYTFTLTGTYTRETHRGASCFNFDGGYSDVNCATRTGGVTQNIGAACTINVVYCSISNQNFNGCSRLFSCGENNSNNVDYSTYFTLASCDESRHGLWRGNNPQGFYPTSATKTVNDSWKMLTFSWTANSTAKVYVDGTLENTTSAGAAFNTAGIGRMTVAMNSSLTIEHARCRVAYVSMYSTQLTDDQVRQNFDAVRDRFGI